MGNDMNGSTDFTTGFAEESKKFFEHMFGMSVDKIPSRVHVLHFKERDKERDKECDIWIDFENVVTLEWRKWDKGKKNAIIINDGKPIGPVFRFREEDIREFEKLIEAYERYMSLKTMPFNAPNSGERGVNPKQT